MSDTNPEPAAPPLPWNNRGPAKPEPAGWQPDVNQLMATLFDSYGRMYKVWRDRSGAVRIDVGAIELMLPLAEWAALERAGNAALDESEAEIEHWKGRNPLPEPGLAVEVTAETWDRYLFNRAWAEHYKRLADADEATLRAEAGNAHFLTVDGKRVATRVAREVDGATWRQDFYRASKGQKVEIRDGQ